MTTLEQLSSKRADVMCVASTHKVRSLSVFGSVAAGEDKPHSDVDFLVEFEADASLLDFIGRQQDIQALLSAPPTSSLRTQSTLPARGSSALSGERTVFLDHIPMCLD